MSSEVSNVMQPVTEAPSIHAAVALMIAEIQAQLPTPVIPPPVSTFVPMKTTSVDASGNVNLSYSQSRVRIPSSTKIVVFPAGGNGAAVSDFTIKAPDGLGAPASFQAAPGEFVDAAQIMPSETLQFAFCADVSSWLKL